MRSGDPLPPRWRFQFGLASLFLVTAIVSVLAAALAGMLQLNHPRLPRGFFVVMAVAAPMAVLLVVSLLRSAVRLWGGRRR